MKKTFDIILSDYNRYIKACANEGNVVEVANLPGDWQYYAGVTFLNGPERSLLFINQKRATVPKWQQVLQKELEEVVKRDSFYAMDFGRKRNIFKGVNRLPSQVHTSYRTEITHRSKYNVYHYFSDYSILFNTKDPFTYRYKTPNMDKTKIISAFDAPICNEEYCFIFDNLLFKRLGWEFDRKDRTILCKRRGFEYHLGGDDIYLEKTRVKDVLKVVAKAFERREKSFGY